MNTRSSSSTDKARVLAAEQAAEWLVRLQDADAGPSTRVEFTAWLQFSPAHVHEFLNARAMWEALSGEHLSAFPDRDTLLRLADEENSADVVWLSGRKTGAPPANTRRRMRFAIAAAIAAIALAGGVVWTVTHLTDRAVYSTQAGEQRTHTLKDGSTVALNTRSRVRLDWSKEYRDIYLDSGEALFQVASDPTRPFRVWSGRSMIRALGTRFNVYRSGDTVTVTVLEGKVQVSTPGNAGAAAASEQISLRAGEQVRVAAHFPLHSETLERPDKTIAWQERRLEFEGAPLSAVIEEFNRYHPTPLVLENPALAARRINGTFDASDRGSLVDFLKEFEGVEIETRPDALMIR